MCLLDTFTPNNGVFAIPLITLLSGLSSFVWLPPKTHLIFRAKAAQASLAVPKMSMELYQWVSNSFHAPFDQRTSNRGCGIIITFQISLILGLEPINGSGESIRLFLKFYPFKEGQRINHSGFGISKSGRSSNPDGPGSFLSKT